MLGDDNQTWDLHIKNVEISDEGLYQCQVLASSKSPPMRSEYATLEVTSRPDPPVLTSGPRLLVKPDSSALVQCISKGQRSKWDYIYISIHVFCQADRSSTCIIIMINNIISAQGFV